MSTLILLRHGKSTANGAGVLAGRSPGVALDDTGAAQASKLVERLAGVPLAEIVCSPMERCAQTVAPLAADRGLTPVTEPELSEVDYGSWTGSALKTLSKEPLWRVVQAHPSAVRFPGGESMLGMQDRAVGAVRDWNERLGREAVYVVCSHGDVIKSILADSLGMHLDMCQRIQVDPCSLSVIRYTPVRPFVLRMNDIAGDVNGLKRPDSQAPAASARHQEEAQVGGGAGG